MKTGFCVMYRWKLRAGMEEQFQSAWESLTHEIRSQCGGLGSRLHQTEDGYWLAYAQWPDRQSWKQAKVSSAAGQRAGELMKAAVEERFEPVLMYPVADLLVPND